MLMILRVKGTSCRDMDHPCEGSLHGQVLGSPWLASIAREVTAGVVISSEVATTCSPVSSLFVSPYSCCCPALCCLQHVRKTHRRHPGSSRVQLPPWPAISMAHRLSFQPRLRGASSHCSRIPAKCLERCIYRGELSPLTTTRHTRLIWHLYPKFPAPTASTISSRS